jgi:hypothetical protein
MEHGLQSSTTKFYSNLALKKDMKGKELKHPSMLLVTC